MKQIITKAKIGIVSLFLFPLGFGVLGAGCTQSGASAGKSSETVPEVSKPTRPVAFRDVTKEAGITYKWVVAGSRPLNILQTIGNGCAFLDYDNDDNLDILLVGPQTALYKGDGKGTFTDVSASVGLNALKSGFLGCTVADYNNDGYEDIYLSAYQGGALLKNVSGTKFENVTQAAGIGLQGWGTSCAFGDVNGDGFLDLYIGNYVNFGPNTDPQLCDNNGIKSACGPRFYKPEKSRLYLGSASGKFRDVTESWQAHKVEGKALGVAFADYDGTGKIHLAIANDEMPGDLLANQGGKFQNIGKESGTAYDDSGNVHGGMGVDWGDYNNDNKLDLLVGTFQNEVKNIYHNDGSNLFTDKSAMLGLASAVPYVTFGAKWLDYDNDGYLDILLSNGHVQDNIAEIDKTTTYRQPTLLFKNNGAERFENVTETALSEAARRPIVGRGLATGDYDNDGKIDALVVDAEGEPLLLHNETPNAGNALRLRLEGKKSNRDAIGARIVVEAGGKTFTRRCATDGSYMSASDKRVHVGMGGATVAEKVTVYWPGGGKTELQNVAPGKTIEVRQK